jgi:hypothetical protein
MRRVFFGLLLAAAATLVILPAAALGAEYESFVGCDELAENPVPSHECAISDSPAAYFASDEEVEYEVCLEYPDTYFICSEPQAVEAEVLDGISLPTDESGLYHVYWYLAETETEIGSWAFEMKLPPPPPPPPPTPPAVPAPTSTPAPVAGPSAACVTAKKRVRRLSGRLHKAHGHKQKAKIRRSLKKARAAVKRLC